MVCNSWRRTSIDGTNNAFTRNAPKTKRYLKNHSDHAFHKTILKYCNGRMYKRKRYLVISGLNFKKCKKSTLLAKNAKSPKSKRCIGQNNGKNTICLH